jgi:hypothetical protein
VKPADLAQAARGLSYAERREIIIDLARDLISGRGSPRNDFREATRPRVDAAASRDIRALLVADIEMIGEQHDLPRQSAIAELGGDPSEETS